MPKAFAQNSNRFASAGVVIIIPSEVIDNIWLIIDQNLQGLLELRNLLIFEFVNSNGNLTLRFSQGHDDLEMDVDTNFAYSPAYPFKVFVYDNGNKQTIMLPEEIQPT